MREEHETIIKDLQNEILQHWSEDEKNNFFISEWGSSSLAGYHHTFGRYIRNKYSLWKIDWEPELIDGVDHSPEHPDNVSSLIIKEVWKRGLDGLQ